jgi:hypothetical protein
MGNEYTPSSDEMKHLHMPSRRDMDFLHSYNNESYMHSNVLDLEKYVRDIDGTGEKHAPVVQIIDDESGSSADEGDGHHPNWNFVIDKEESISVGVDLEWELICGEGMYDWEMI